MPIPKKLILGSRILAMSVLPISMLTITSCKKAPANGEAFITLKSNEVRFLADTEIVFFGEGFAQEFDTFRKSLVSETRKDLLSQIDKFIAEAKLEKQSLESSRTSLIAMARDEAIKKLEETKSELMSKIENNRQQISKTDTLEQSLAKSFVDYPKKEAEIVSKINDIQTSADKIASLLVAKINLAIVEERIPIKKYEPEFDPHVPIKPRSLAEMMVSYSLIPIKLSGISKWISLSEEHYLDNPFYKHDFIIVRYSSTNGAEFDKGVFAERLSNELNFSKIADNIRRDLSTIIRSANQINELYGQAKANNDLFNKQIQIWANSSNITVDSIKEKLHERFKLRSELHECEIELSSIQEGRDVWNKTIQSAETLAQNDYNESLEVINGNIVVYEERAERVKSDTSFEKQHGAHRIMVEKIAEMLISKKLSATRTGSDGKFSVPPKARYVSAFLKRGQSEEEIFWLIKINMEDETVKLSNSNITMACDEDAGSAFLGALHANLDK